MQKIDLFGMELVDHSLKESLWITDSFLKSGAPSTILFVSAKMLVGADGSDTQKEWIKAADLIVWSDAKVLQQAGIVSKNRIREVENQEYIKEVLKKLGKRKKTIYLLAQSEEQLEKLREDLLHLRNDLLIVGERVVDVDESVESLVNEINSKTPTAVISRLPYLEQEKLMVETKKYLCAEVWMALNYQMILNEDRPAALKKLLNNWYHFVFQKLIKKYETKEETKAEDF